MPTRINQVTRTCLLTLFAFLLSTSAYGETIKGIDIPSQITQPVSRQTLHLNGAGIRSKFVFSIYIGALYLPAPAHTVNAILKNDSPRRVLMHCLYHEIDKETLTSAWREGFDDNNDKQTLAQLDERITVFNRLFPALRTGDVVIFDYIPGKGTILRFNNKDLGTIPGLDFNNALLRIWLGDSPADSSLKSAMLGESTD